MVNFMFTIFKYNTNEQKMYALLTIIVEWYDDLP